MKDTARRAAVATLAGGSIIVLALALWKLRLVLGLLFFAFILAAAIRPSIEWLTRIRETNGSGSAATSFWKVASFQLTNPSGAFLR